MAMYVYPYKPGSKGAKALSEAGGFPRIKHQGSRFRGTPDKTVINWGASDLKVDIGMAHLLNPPGEVQLASNKLNFFTHMNEEGLEDLIPDYTTSRDVASDWIEDGNMVVCRTILNGHSGRGIVLARTVDELVEAPLYTKYVKKRDEYRVHCVLKEEGASFLVTKKARKLDVPDDQVNWQIRNHDNGFIYALDEDPSARLTGMCQTVLEAFDLDFGAVDAIYNVRDDLFYVLEINTAPGLEGRTIQFYADAFRGMV